MSPEVRPLVTIGLPVYNGGDTLRRVLESIVVQTRKDFKVVISDNASSDSTESICREFQKKDDRLVYVRQPSNIGAEANFDFVLSAADTKYFMWAAADDVRSSEFLEKNVEYLEVNPDFVASTCPVRFEGCDFDPIHMGDLTLDESDPFERILKFLEVWHANGQMYSLFRTEALTDTKMSECRYLGGDWTIVANLLVRGKFKRLTCGYVERGKRGVSNGLDIFTIYRTRLVCWVFPFFDMARELFKIFRNARFQQKVKLFVRLLRLNFSAFRTQIKFAMQKRGRRNRRALSVSGS
jgi:glycosyltransferase involved in cell wall biosynthesis